MFQFRPMGDNKLLLGRPQSVERAGLAALLAGLALVGAPLTGEFVNWVPMLVAGVALVVGGIRLCFLYSRITITRLEGEILVEGYWFRSAFRVKREELRAICNCRHNMRRPWWIRNSLRLVRSDDSVDEIYVSLSDLATQDDAALLARFLDVPCERDTDWNQLKRGLGIVWKALWHRKERKRHP